MTFTSLTGLLNTLSSLGLAAFVFSKRPRHSTNQAYLFFGLTVGLYSVGYFFWGLARGEAEGLFAFKILTSGIILINSAYLEFAFSLLGERQKRRWILWACHAANLYFVYATFSLQLFKSVAQKNIWGYWPVVENLFYIYFALWLGQFLYGLFNLYIGYKRTHGQPSTQIKYVFVSTLIGYFGGATNWLPWFNITLFPPHLNILVTAYVAVLAYAVVRHRLMDIEVVIKKTIVFAGIVAAAVSVIAFPFALIQAVIGKALGVPDPFILMALGIATAILIYRPVERVLVNITDKYLFQKKQEIKVILNRLSERVVTILDLKQIGKTVLSTLEETFRLESAMIFFRDRKSEKYRLLEYFGLQPNEFANSVKSFFEQSDISNFLLNHKPILALDHFDPQRVPSETKNWLGLAKARVCIPLMVDEDHKGLLVLGKKKSDQEFAQEETDYFPTIASQVSLAIQKALLVETVLEEREAKIKAEHVAERVRFARTIKHEQKNSLAGMESPARFLSMYHVPDLKKAFKENDEEWFVEICSKIDKVSQDICKGVDKVLDIAEASLGGMETVEQPFRKISFKVIWEDAKESSGVKGCDYESTMPDGFAVCVRYAPFERVLENLIINANDAMKDRDQRLIRLNCSYSEIDGKQVAYFEFRDNGPGISKEIHDKIFQQGFSTKPKPDDANLSATGYGQGLYVCKNNIENIHHGKIWVESELGEGAIFKFWIPMSGNG